MRLVVDCRPVYSLCWAFSLAWYVCLCIYAYESELNAIPHTHTHSHTHPHTHTRIHQAYILHEYAMYLVQQCQIRVKFISSSHAACVAASGFVSNNLNCNRQTTCHIEEICHSAAAHSTSIQGKATPIDLTLLISLLFHFRVAPAPCLCCKRRKKTAQEV